MTHDCLRHRPSGLANRVGGPRGIPAGRSATETQHWNTRTLENAKTLCSLAFSGVERPEYRAGFLNRVSQVRILPGAHKSVTRGFRSSCQMNLESHGIRSRFCGTSGRERVAEKAYRKPAGTRGRQNIPLSLADVPGMIWSTPSARRSSRSRRSGICRFRSTHGPRSTPDDSDVLIRVPGTGTISCSGQCPCDRL